MPQAVLDSPMGRMLLPHLTQGVNSSRQNGSILGLQQSGQQATPSHVNSAPKVGVHNVTSSTELSRLLEGAKKTSAVIFFTSATCPPCKTVYPLYDQLAEELEGKVTLIKVDISLSRDIASQYSIRATPTFISFLRGKQENQWTGANPATLRGNLQLLAQMADSSHSHSRLKLPSFNSPDLKPVLYTKTPPLAKLLPKMGEDVASKTEVQNLKAYIEERESKGPIDAVLPNLSHLSSLVQNCTQTMSLETLFAVVDLFRCALIDARVSGYFAEEKENKTVLDVIQTVNSSDSCPYALRLVTLQMGCNLFSTPLFSHEILRNSTLLAAFTQLISSSFLDESHNNVRVAASSLLFNVALANRRAKTEESASILPESDQVELAASVVEAIDQENKSAEALQGMLLALGHLFYGADLRGELADLLRALDAEGTILGKKKHFPTEKLVHEVGAELLGKGLRKP
jgi:desumoylating isopeptidase 1